MILDMHLYAGPSLFRRSCSEDELVAGQGAEPDAMALLCPAKPPSGSPAEAHRAVEALAFDRLAAALDDRW